MSNKHDHDKKGQSTSDLYKNLKTDTTQTNAVDDDSDDDGLANLTFPELRLKLKEAEGKAAQHWDRLLRMQADAENTSRRVERDIANAHKYGQEKFVMELLPVVDNMERGLQLPEDAKIGHEAVLEGVQLTLKMFIDALRKFEVEAVNPLNEMFNPEFHQAISVQVDPAVKPGTVLNVLQKGYTLNKRLIRPAMVVVSKAD